MIECKICNKKVGTKGFPIHLRMHGIKFHDYVQDHLNDFPMWGKCEVCGTLTKRSGRARHITCSCKCSGTLKAKLYKGRPTWNKGLTKDDHPAMKQASDKLKGQQRRLGAVLSEETKQKISKTRIERGVAKGKNNPMYGKTHTPEAIEKIHSFKKMNTLERLVANTLTEAGIEYTFQFFLQKDGCCKAFDFKIKGTDILIEVDGDYWHGNPAVKHHWKDVDSVRENDEVKSKLAVNHGYTLLRFWESDIKHDPNIITNELANVKGF